MNLIEFSTITVSLFLIFIIIILILLKKLRLAKAIAIIRSVQLEKYSIIIDTEEEAKSIIRNAENKVSILEVQISELRSSYAEKKSIFDELEKTISIYHDDLKFTELGMYEPHFDFDTSEEFKSLIKENRDKQKEMLRIKSQEGAIWCGTNWTVRDSRTEGKK